MKAGQTPLPAVWALEMRSDVKSDFRGVRYYVANQEDCLKHFGVTQFDNDVDYPVCYSQSERSWTEREDVSSHPLSPCCRYDKMFVLEIFDIIRVNGCLLLAWVNRLVDGFFLPVESKTPEWKISLQDLSESGVCY